MKVPEGRPVRAFTASVCGEEVEGWGGGVCVCVCVDGGMYGRIVCGGWEEMRGLGREGKDLSSE